MTDLLWTVEELHTLTNHPKAGVREWALERLTKLFPEQAVERTEKMLEDEDVLVRLTAVKFLGETGDKKYGPLLLEKLKQATGLLFVVLAEALGDLGFREAAPIVVAYAQREEPQYDWFRFYRVCEVLTELGGEEVRQGLWTLLDQLSPDDFRVGRTMVTLLEVGRPEDVDRLVQRYRSWYSSERPELSPQIFAEAARADELLYFLQSRWQNNVLFLMGHADDWLGHIPEVSDACINRLTRAFTLGYQGVFDILLDEAGRFFQKREDDVAAWQAAWEAGQPPVGYRREAVMIRLILAAFAAHPAPEPAERELESLLGLSLIFQLSTDRDDQERLEASEDKTRTLLSILAENREHVLPGVVDQVVNLGPEIAPRLVRMLRSYRGGWHIIRLVEAIWRVARRYPGSCDAAVPYLINLIDDNQGDALLELASDALAAIGPVAVPEVGRHLQDDDMSRQIYLTGVLSEIPTEESARLLLSQIDPSQPDQFDDMFANALVDIGYAPAIEPLYQIWQTVDKEDEELDLTEKELLRALLLLCDLHDVNKPDLPRWRQIVETGKTDFLEDIKH